MLTGRRAFSGESTAETMSAILKEDPPDLSQTNRTIAPALERVVHHCLEKPPERRFQTASDLGFALEALSTTTGSRLETATIESTDAGSKWRKWLPWAVTTAVLLLALLAFSLPYFRRAQENAPVVRSSILPPENANFLSIGQMAISPDGRRLAFVARGEDRKRLLWVRPLNALAAQPLAGTDEAAQPFWSPDSRFLGFFAGGKLKKIDASGGPTQTLCDAPNPRGGAWNAEGVILFTPNNTGPLHRVSAAGGASLPVTKLDESSGERTHRYVAFLPDGRHFLYRAAVPGPPVQKAESHGVYLGSLGSDERRKILRDATNVAFASGYLLFWREGALMAQAFDTDKLQLTGDAFSVAEQVSFDPAGAIPIFTVSENGVLAFQRGAVRSSVQLVWHDRSSKQTSLVEPDYYASPRLSPDGQRVAVTVFDTQAGGTDIWILELARNMRTRFTFSPGFDLFQSFTSLAFKIGSKARICAAEPVLKVTVRLTVRMSASN